MPQSSNWMDWLLKKSPEKSAKGFDTDGGLTGYGKMMATRINKRRAKNKLAAKARRAQKKQRRG